MGPAELTSAGAATIGASLVAAAARHLERWPDALRVAPCSFWEQVKRGAGHPLWSLVRSLDLSGAAAWRTSTSSTSRRSPRSPPSRACRCRQRRVGDRSARAQPSRVTSARLTVLDLSGCRIGSEGLAALAKSPGLPALRELSVPGNGVGPSGVAALKAREGRLEVLDLSDNDIRADGVSALASADALGALRVLRLAGNRIGPDGVAALSVGESVGPPHGARPRPQRHRPERAPRPSP